MTLGVDKSHLKGDRAFLLVKSARPVILPTANYLYLYMQHINTLLTARYLQIAKDALVIIEVRFKDYFAINDFVVNNTLEIDRYIKSVEEGAEALIIDRPTRPREATSPAKLLILAVIAGGIISIFYVFLRSAIRRHKAETGMAASGSETGLFMGCRYVVFYPFPRDFGAQFQVISAIRLRNEQIRLLPHK